MEEKEFLIAWIAGVSEKFQHAKEQKRGRAPRSTSEKQVSSRKQMWEDRFAFRETARGGTVRRADLAASTVWKSAVSAKQFAFSAALAVPIDDQTPWSAAPLRSKRVRETHYVTYTWLWGRYSLIRDSSRERVDNR